MKAPAVLTLVLALVAVLAAPVKGEMSAESFVSGAKLNERCRSEDLTARALCLGYVLGVIDETPSLLLCAPQSVTAQEVLEAVTLHLERYPSDRAFPGHVIVRLAVREAWPCDP